MIRKAIIILLSLGVVGTGLAWAMSGWYQMAYKRWVCTSPWKVLVYLDMGCLNCSAYKRSDLKLSEHYDSPWRLVSHPRHFFFMPRYGSTGRAMFVTIPLWMPLIVFATYPTLAFIRGPLRRRHRSRRGLCVQCGYNLTGLPEPRCPECGAEA